MFLEEADFDESGEGELVAKQSTSPPRFAPPASKNATGGGELALVDMEDSNEDSGFHTSSRARMLAQQRELQLKKRQSILESGGMIRSSADFKSSEDEVTRKSQDAQFTPAVRQFSAPKAVKESSSDFAESRSEFNRPEPVKVARAQKFDIGVSEQRENYYRGGRRDDNYVNNDDDDDYDYHRENRGNRSGGWDRGLGSRDRDRDRRDKDRRRDDDRDRRDKDRRNNGRGGRGRRYNDEDDYQDFDDDDDDDDEDAMPKKPTKQEKKGSAIKKSGHKAQAKPEPEESQPLDLRDMRRFLTTPVPKECGIVKCCIRRNQSGMNKLFPLYSLYLSDGDAFLMASRKRSTSKLSNYVITSSESDVSRDGTNFLGKLRKKNMVGTDFVVFDDGISPDDPDLESENKRVRQELGAVTYAPNFGNSRGPRKMQVAVPAVDDSGQPISTRPIDLLTRIKDRQFKEVVYMINKPPRWNEDVGAYVLNFNGRVTMASVKNFQLVDPDAQERVILQFGRTDKNSFNMDLRWPLSPLQAFAITLSSFDGKMACD
jgi:tubby and related proteins